ncbi:MAG TPA: P63C domain-containing protein [Methylocella sp.]|nr:P63C domain-containing protein [Methylocella sp.]
MDENGLRGQAGGRARAEILPPERKQEIARKAAQARWLAATHRGNFKKDFGLDIDCYVLNDALKTAVISQRGMGQAIGFSKRGSRLPVFVNSKTMDGYIGRDLRAKIEKPLVFQASAAAAGNSVSGRAYGYDAAILIDLCNSILTAKADGKLKGGRYNRMTEQAQTIVSASAKSGIQRLVYALAGYNPSSEEVIEAFKLYVQEEARKYEPEFPNELYMQWHRLYNLAVPDRGKPWQFRHLTVRHVYYPLAKSSGKILDLLRALKAQDGDQSKKLFQFLNKIGARALRIQLGRILEMAESSPNRTEYEKKVIDRFGGQRELDLVLPIPSIAPPLPSAQLRLDLPGIAS